MSLFLSFRNAVSFFESYFRNIAKNRIFTIFVPLTHGKLQDLAVKILYQWTVNLTKVIISNFYIDISFGFFFFYNVKNDRHNLTNLSHFLCNFCTFDMVCIKSTGKETKGDNNIKI